MRRRRRRPASFSRHPPPTTRWEQWRARTLAWGALAAAVAAIIGLGPALVDLWPDPDPEDAGAITRVDVVSPVPLSEHDSRVSGRQQRDTSLRAPRAQPIAGGDDLGVVAVSVSAPADDAAQAGTEDDARLDDQVDQDEPNTSGDEGVEEPDASNGASSQSEETDVREASENPGSEAPGDAQSDAGAEKREVPQRDADAEPNAAPSTPGNDDEPSRSRAIRVLPPAALAVARASLISVVEAGQYDTAWCGDEDSQGAREDCEQTVISELVYFVTPTAQSPEGSELAAIDVAEALVEFFEDVRTVEAPAERGRSGDSDSGKTVPEPVGASLAANIELSGLRGQTVDMAWSIFKVGGGDPLLGRWLSTTPAYRLQPSTNRDTTSVPLWIPLPRDTGRYFVRLTLSIDGTTLGSADSPEFGDDVANDAA